MNVDEIKNIDPSKDSLKFIAERIKLSNYRGVQISQHNRFNYDQVLGMLKIFYDLVGKDKMQIRTTDLSKRPFNIAGEEIYAKYTHLVNNEFGKGSQDSIRKNIFVDFHRMGLIKRFDSNNKTIDIFEKKSTKYVSLTSLALDLIDDTISVFERYMIFTRALDNILKGFASDMLDIIAEFDYLTLNEFMYIVSFLNQKFDDRIIVKEKIIELLKDYRNLSKYQEEYLDNIVRDICDPQNFTGSKVNKRDHHNWRNEAQQIFTILNMTVYYEKNKERLLLMTGENKLFENKNKLKRSVNEKKNYFKKHDVSKERGFEIHHIVPLSWSRSREEFFLLDKWENMLYIDGYSHAQITQNSNNNVRLFIKNNNDVTLVDFDDSEVYLSYKKDVKYSPVLRSELEIKNDELLNL